MGVLNMQISVYKSYGQYFENGTYESANYICNQRCPHLTKSFLYCLVFYSVV